MATGTTGVIMTAGITIGTAREVLVTADVEIVTAGNRDSL